MLSRHDISDDHWGHITDRLPGRTGRHGGVGNDTRLFHDAVRHLAKTGIAWADLPTCYGKPNSLWQRYNRWCRNEVWAEVAALRDDDTEWLSVDSSCVRATAAAAGADKMRTAPEGRPRKRWAAAAGGSGPRFTPSSAPSATPSNFS